MQIRINGSTGKQIYKQICAHNKSEELNDVTKICAQVKRAEK